MTPAPLAPEAFDQAVALVAASGLPVADLDPGRQRFWAVGTTAGLVGVIAWERAGGDALVRSFAVEADVRGRGVGTALYRTLEAEARRVGVARLVLLTETAEGFFRRQGFISTPRESLSDEVRATAEFTGLCPVSAVCLAKSLF